MLKQQAIALLGGSVTTAATAIGVSYQAVDKWPEVLTAKLVDRVQAALWRIQHGIPHPVPKNDEVATEASRAGA